MVVFLVPAGRDRFELYSEAFEEADAPLDAHAGRIRRWLHRANQQWREIVEHARRGKARGRVARWRDRIVCRLAENIAEQRTLWSLRSLDAAMLRYPSTLDEAQARQTLSAALERARAHHLRWFVIDAVLFVSSVVFFFIPGPNLVAYYFAFRFVGHLQSLRGARRAMDVVQWRYEPDASLSELGTLVDIPRDARAPRVAAIAARLNLRRLTTFFERVAVRST